MTTSLHTLSSEAFVPMLRSLSALLDKAAEYATARKFDSGVLASARLAPDMFSLAQQVQVASDQAKRAVARLTGQQPPRFEDNETTIDELKARIAKTIDYLESVKPEAFAGADVRKITLPLGEKLLLEAPGWQYLRDWALPNFYFHVVTAYDILRHNGVEIGKLDYFSQLGGLIHERR